MNDNPYVDSGVGDSPNNPQGLMRLCVSFGISDEKPSIRGSFSRVAQAIG